MENINDEKVLEEINEKFLVDCVITALKERAISPEIISANVHVNYPDGTPLTEVAISRIAKEAVVLLSNWGIVAPLTDVNEDGSVQTIIHCWNAIDEDIKGLLKRHGHTEEEIRSILNELPDAEKEIVSEIINENWNAVAENGVPEDGKIYALRVYDPTRVIKENDHQKILLEEIKLGIWKVDKGEWYIVPPHPFIEYSPLTNGPSLASGEVSHWRSVTDSEFDSWIHRYDPISTYAYLDIIVDEEHKKDTYKALVFGNNMLNEAARQQTDPAMKESISNLANILSDLAGCFDRGSGVCNDYNGFENELKRILDNLNRERDPNNFEPTRLFKTLED